MKCFPDKSETKTNISWIRWHNGVYDPKTFTFQINFMVKSSKFCRLKAELYIYIYIWYIFEKHLSISIFYDVHLFLGKRFIHFHIINEWERSMRKFGLKSCQNLAEEKLHQSLAYVTASLITKFQNKKKKKNTHRQTDRQTLDMYILRTSYVSNTFSLIAFNTNFWYYILQRTIQTTPSTLQRIVLTQ